MLPSLSSLLSLTVFTLTIFSCPYSIGSVDAVEDPNCTDDRCRSTMQLAQSNGYSIEQHKVDTEDCFTLTLFRLTGKVSAVSSRVKPVVFLQHGLMDLSDTWLINGPSQSLGYILSDAGFDVWMG